MAGPALTVNVADSPLQMILLLVEAEIVVAGKSKVADIPIKPRLTEIKGAPVSPEV